MWLAKCYIKYTKHKQAGIFNEIKTLLCWYSSFSMNFRSAFLCFSLLWMFFPLKDSLRTRSSGYCAAQIPNPTLEVQLFPQHIVPVLCVTIAMLFLDQSCYVLWCSVPLLVSSGSSVMHGIAEHHLCMPGLSERAAWCPSPFPTPISAGWELSDWKFLYPQGVSGGSKSEFVNKWKLPLKMKLKLL